MVIKVKVSEVAKDFGKQSKEIIELLSKYCEGPAKKSSSTLEENELNIIFDKLTQDNSVKNFDKYFGSTKKNKSVDKKPNQKKTKKPIDSEKEAAKNKKASKPSCYFTNGRASC